MNNIKNYKLINIDNILNYEENPRHDIATNQKDTLKMLIDKVGATYMFNLSRDIYFNGLINANVPVVVWDDYKKKYIVYEGNRRIACLKILDNPNLIISINKPLKERIDKLLLENKPNYSRDVQCFVTDRSHAFFIMERIHAGEDKGRGLKAWSSREKQVFSDRKEGTPSIELVISKLNNEFFGKDITKEIKYTNIQRFFNNREVKKALNISNPKRDIDREKLLLINYLINEAKKKGEIENRSLSRLFNRARDIEDFFIPIIKDYTPKGNEKYENSKVTKKANSSLENKTNLNDNISDKYLSSNSSKEKQNKIEISLKNKQLQCNEMQSINLLDNLELVNKDAFEIDLLETDSEKLSIKNGIVQPNNNIGSHIVVYKYFESLEKKNIYWQDSITIKITPINKSYEVPKSNTVLSQVFVDEYYDFLNFEHSKKFKSLMKFLSEEKIDGKYSHILNITSRMFLEYSFRIYASEILKINNDEIDKLSKSLPSFIGHCCSKIDQENPAVFVKHVTLAKKDAINKIDLLQKSVHYYNVDISPIDIQNIFKNLNIYLEYIYSKVIKIK